MPITNATSLDGICLNLYQSFRTSDFPGYATRAHTMLRDPDLGLTQDAWRHMFYKFGPNSVSGLLCANAYEATRLLAPVARVISPMLCSVLGTGAKPQVSAPAPVRGIAYILRSIGVRPSMALEFQRYHQPNMCVWRPDFESILFTTIMGGLAGIITSSILVAGYAGFTLAYTWLTAGCIVGVGALVAIYASASLNVWATFGAGMGLIGALSISAGQWHGNDELSRYGEEICGCLALMPLVVMGVYLSVFTSLYMRSELPETLQTPLRS